jgi:hypothetical protein
MRPLRFAVALAAILAGCDPEVHTNIVNPPAKPLQLQAGGTSCEGYVVYSVGSVSNAPDGDPFDFPVSIGVDAHSGDAVTMTACNTCVLAGCPILPCDVTIDAAIVWKGKTLATGTSTSPPDTTCLPSVTLTATIP